MADLIVRGKPFREYSFTKLNKHVADTLLKDAKQYFPGAILRRDKNKYMYRVFIPETSRMRM